MSSAMNIACVTLSKSKAAIRVMAEWFGKNPNESECVRELCRRVCMVFGASSLGRPFVELGTALTKAKSVSCGVDVDSLVMTQHDAMTPSPQMRGIRHLISEATLSSMQQIKSECEIVDTFLSSKLWEDDFHQVMKEHEAEDIHTVILDALTVTRDVLFLLTSAIDNSLEAGLQFVELIFKLRVSS